MMPNTPAPVVPDDGLAILAWTVWPIDDDLESGYRPIRWVVWRRESGEWAAIASAPGVWPYAELAAGAVAAEVRPGPPFSWPPLGDE